MLIKTVLNRLEHFKSFVFGSVTFQEINGSEALIVEIKARANSKPEYPECGKHGKKRDTQPVRLFEYVPIWAFKVFFQYAPRRVGCPIHGVKVERMPWVKLFKAENQENVLLKGRWILLKNKENLNVKQITRLKVLLKLNIASIKG